MRFLAFCLAIVGAAPVAADTVRVAVAANFHAAAAELAQVFQAETGHRVELISGATGALYAQIVQGAPFDVFLSADRARIDALDRDGLLVPDGRFVYAEGLLVLWSPDAGRMRPDAERSLRLETTMRFAMADPAVAPYGQAALQVLNRLGLDDVGRDKAVIGASVGQAFALVSTGNAQMGFVALSQVTDMDGAWYRVPDGLYDPIQQEAGLLARARDNETARRFFTWLRGDRAGDIVRAAGYRRDP